MSNLNIKEVQKMLLIYNALLDGWTIRLVEENKVEFKKPRNSMEINLDNYINEFLIRNLNIEQHE